ncbi:MAG TPA: 6-phosphogluconolactonase [Tepidisphaeraceae bacterium]|jgi:6-phosphogluconolactonase|nr:6-phosphogluconolactonase [Tepidisphaeraceae bacterium]
MNEPEIKVLPDANAIARDAANRIVRLSEEAIEASGRFSIALSGGSTPKTLYTLLASPEFVTKLDWPAIDLFFGDERCVPPTHPESNYRMADEALISKVPIPRDNVYRMRGEIDPNEAAREYGLMLKDHFGDRGVDLNLLGMGDDGHTASLFPGTAAVDEKDHRVVANYAEHSTTGKSWRITMTFPFINKSQNIIVMVAGAAKAAALKDVLQGPRDPHRLPIQFVQPIDGQITWLLDTAAAAMQD